MHSRSKWSSQLFRLVIVIAVSSLAAATACAGGGEPYPTAPSDSNPGGNDPGPVNGKTVTLMQSSFSPQTLTVASGTTVSWVWSPCTGDGYSSCPMHNIAFDDGSNITSGNRDAGEFTRNFAAAGTFRYHCTIHGSGMSGQVVVK